jgi:hypothetical protein
MSCIILLKQKKKPKEKEVIHNVEKMEQEIGYWEVQEAEQRFFKKKKSA